MKIIHRSQLDLLYEKMSQESKVQQSIQLKNQNRRDSHNQDDDEEDLLNTSVFFWNLPHHITEEALYKLCAYYGHVRSVTIKYPFLEDTIRYSVRNSFNSLISCFAVAVRLPVTGLASSAFRPCHQR